MTILNELLKAQAYTLLWELLKTAFTIDELNKGEDKKILEQIEQEKNTIKQQDDLNRLIDQRINNNPIIKQVVEQNIRVYINEGKINSEILQNYDINRLC